MASIKEWLIALLVTLIFGVYFAYDDGLADQQKSAEVERDAIASAQREELADLHQRIADANVLLGLK